MIAFVSLSIVGVFLAHIMFVSFEHRDDHNGVGWAKFAKSIKKHIESTEFEIIDFGHYEGKVYFDELRSGNKSIKFGMFTRGSYSDPRDMQTLKHARINNIGGYSVSCVDDLEHEIHTSISILSDNAHTKFSSIKDILTAYDSIESLVTNYEDSTYLVKDEKVVDAPSWLYINAKHHCSNSEHEVQALTCKVKSDN